MKSSQGLATEGREDPSRTTKIFYKKSRWSCFWVICIYKWIYFRTDSIFVNVLLCNLGLFMAGGQKANLTWWPTSRPDLKFGSTMEERNFFKFTNTKILRGRHQDRIYSLAQWKSGISSISWDWQTRQTLKQSHSEFIQLCYWQIYFKPGYWP